MRFLIHGLNFSIAAAFLAISAHGAQASVPSAGELAVATSITSQVDERTAREYLVRTAEGDNFYEFDYSDPDSFESGTRQYGTEDGYVTNFGPELFPLLPQTDGEVYLRSETVESRDRRLEDGRTTLQIDFNF